jgi:nucleoside-diphosphate-sugar epimerase
MQTDISETQQNLLIVGGQGITGQAIFDVATTTPHWEVKTASRRPSSLGRNGVQHVSLDLLDEATLGPALLGAGEITALAYCAYLPVSDEQNVVAFSNLLRGLEKRQSLPARIVVMGGGKSYGGHLGPNRTPARESDPRVMGPIFYDQQQDLLDAWATRNDVQWTILRPDPVIGPSIGSPMNLLTGIAVYAAICRELGLALRFPGSFKTWNGLYQMTDAGLLGKSALWAIEADSAANQIFNVINGDQFRWKHLWKEIADFFEMPVDEPHPMNLTERMADKGPVWNRVVNRYGLLDTPWESIAAWGFVDWIFNIPFDLVQSTIKIRKAGFADCFDTHESVRSQLARLRQMRLIP